VANYYKRVLGIRGQPRGGTYPEKEKTYSEANTIFCGAVIEVLVENLQDTYLRYKTAKEMWDTLNTEYIGSDASTKLYIIEQYHDYHMVDEKSVVTQAHEIQSMVLRFDRRRLTNTNKEEKGLRRSRGGNALRVT
jgi:hypothetical protein